MSFRTVLLILGAGSVLFAGAGYALHIRGGLPQRFDIAPGAETPGSYAAYNDRVFARYKRDAFTNAPGRRLLVLGNSQGRDFVNMVDATGVFAGYEIVYRDDAGVCRLHHLSPTLRRLFVDATLIVQVNDHVRHPVCNLTAAAAAPVLRGKLLFVGPKDFGENINPAARLPLAARATATVSLSPAVQEANAYYRSVTPPGSYVDLIRNVSADGRRMPIFDHQGRILSEDRVHLTRAGAAFVGQRLFRDRLWQKWRSSP